MPSNSVLGKLSAVAVICFWILVGCEGEQDSERLAEAIDLGRENVVVLEISSDQEKVLFEPGEVWQFTANATREDGTQFDASNMVKWKLTPADAGSISDVGVLTAADVSGEQVASVTVEWAQLHASSDITISDAELIVIAISAASNPLAECLTTPLSAVGQYTDGSERVLTDLTWLVDSPDLARVDDSDLIALTSGTFNLSASRGDVTSESLPIVATDSLAAINLSETSPVTAKVDELLQISATGIFSDSSETPDIGAATNWSNSNTSVLSISDDGELLGIAAGDATVTATCGGLEEMLLVTVIDVTDIRIVDPEDNDMAAGETRQLELYKEFSDGSLGTDDIADDSDVIWDIETGEEIASISEDGEVTLASDISNYEDSFIRIFAEFDDFEDTLTIRLDD